MSEKLTSSLDASAQSSPHPAGLSTLPARVVDPKSVEDHVYNILGRNLHAKRVGSLSDAVLGAISATSLAICTIGAGLALAKGLKPKHATKQIDRLLSNEAIGIDKQGRDFIKHIIGDRDRIIVALDWTDYDADQQSTLVLDLITRHGRATKLLWKTIKNDTLKENRNRYEDELMLLLRELTPESVHITVLADRGFGDKDFYGFLKANNLDFIIRFRSNIYVTSAGGVKKLAKDWLREKGRLLLLQGAGVTANAAPVARIVIVQAAGMKEMWCLASSREDLSGADTKKLYGKRFTIEETNRDTKDLHFGMGLAGTHIKSPARRDRLLFVMALAHSLLTLLGAAAEKVGLDRELKVNTAKKRTHSLFRQGSYWFRAIQTMPEEKFVKLMTAFAEVLAQHKIFRDIFGFI